MATKITVPTDVGTFTRTTARTYTHIVVVMGHRSDWLEARRLSDLAAAKKSLAKYVKTVETGVCPDERPGRSGVFDREMTAKFLADGSYAGWIASARERIAAMDAAGPVTEDGTTPWFVHGWAGRFDLAVKAAAASDVTDIYRNVRIYEVATGKRVR